MTIIVWKRNHRKNHKVVCNTQYSYRSETDKLVYGQLRPTRLVFCFGLSSVFFMSLFAVDDRLISDKKDFVSRVVPDIILNTKHGFMANFSVVVGRQQRSR